MEVVFDFDGTIADTFEFTKDTLISLSPRYGFPVLLPSDISRLRNQSLKQVIQTLKIPLWQIPFIGRDLQQALLNHLDQIRPFPQLVPVLSTLSRRGHLLSILTSNSATNVSRFLDIHQINLFRHIYGNISAFSKHRHLARLSQHHPIIYVGDEIRDIESAHQARIQIIAVSWGWNSRRGLAASSPDYLVDHPSELLNLLP
jgi:phosphoglycolate phosphatase-like HAD superfamily hydrolase